MFERDSAPSEDVEQRPDNQGLLGQEDAVPLVTKKTRRHWYLLGAVAAGVGAAAALVWSARVIPSKSTVGNAEEATTLAEGAPDRCSAPGKDCRQTKCCSAAQGGGGMTCYEKDMTWASCAASCTAADWTCKALGNRTLYSAGCGWAGKSCEDTHLCCNKGFVCAARGQAWPACTQIPQDSDGKVLGGARHEYEIAPAALGEKVLGTSLYCYMAFPRGSDDASLHDVAKENTASIFGCDGYDVFHSWQFSITGWGKREAKLFETNVLINVWNNMLDSGKFLQYDWTVKADPDALLLPDRLKKRVEALRPPAGKPIYLMSGAMDPGEDRDTFPGAIEVFSREAVLVYRDNKQGCHESLDMNAIEAGKGGYFKVCMDALGVGFMADPLLFILSSPPSCPGACYAKLLAGFHPLKTVNDWKCCLDITKGISHKVEYGVCNMSAVLPRLPAH